MNLAAVDRPVPETHPREALLLAPPSLAIASPQPPELPDRRPAAIVSMLRTGPATSKSIALD